MSAIPRSPNVVFVLTDEWRAQALGYAGDSNARTEAIDRFAAESHDFREAVSGNPVCCPARASFLTGQYPLNHGVYINDVELVPTGVTLGEAFREAGYRTGYIGKWHLYGSPDGRYGRREDFIPTDKRFGFDYWKVAECTHDYNQSFYYEGDDSTKKYWEGYDAIAQTEDACRFIEAYAHADDPYFLVLSLGPPHFPLKTAPEQYQRLYADQPIDLRPNVPQEDADAAAEDLRGYYAHIAALDDCFARLLQVLEETGTADDTVVVFTSDHGDMMGSQGLSANQKHYPWEESIRVPLLIRYPAMLGPGGTRSSALINSPDIMPTLLGLCGISIPEGVQGTNFFSSEIAAELPTTSAFLNLPVPFWDARTHGIAEYRGVRDTQFTYVRAISGPWLLYDNLNDPYQMQNLCGKPEAQDAQSRLDAELDAWLEALGDEFLPAGDYIDRDSLGHYFEVNVPIGQTQSPWGEWESTIPDAQRPSIE